MIQRFAMPALEIIPNAQQFYEAVYRAGVYGSPRHYARDVLQVAFDHLGITGRRALSDGLKRLRRVPDEDGNQRDTAIFEMLDYSAVQDAVRRLFRRIEEHEQEVGFAEIDPPICTERAGRDCVIHNQESLARAQILQQRQHLLFVAINLPDILASLARQQVRLDPAVIPGGQDQFGGFLLCAVMAPVRR